MASYRPAVPAATKRELIEEAGGKCANPGCPNRLVEIHHIRRWAVYQTHDGAQMIAVCAACHDAVERGSLRIEDEELYRWKTFNRDVRPSTSVLYIEPGEETKLLIGSMAVTGQPGVIVFELSEDHRLSFGVENERVMLLDLRLTDLDGATILSARDNRITEFIGDPVQYEQRPGRFRVSAPAERPYILPWALRQVRRAEPGYAPGELLTLLDVNVLGPGLVRVEGLWLKRTQGIAITDKAFHTLQTERPLPITLIGAGEDSVLLWRGPVGMAMFAFQAEKAATPRSQMWQELVAWLKEQPAVSEG